MSFGWQRGYGALTVGERHRPAAEAYVRNQKAHHAHHSTNAWLEQCTELDEGPPDTGLCRTPGAPGVAELWEAYDVRGEAAF